MRASREKRCSIFLTNDNQSQPRMWIWIGVQDVRALHTQYAASTETNWMSAAASGSEWQTFNMTKGGL